MPHKYFLIILLLFFCVSAKAQSGSNACGVVARFTPQGDSVVGEGNVMEFQNASTNATSYKFFIDGYAISENTTLYYGFNVGLHHVKLVAYNGSCTDTAVSYFFNPGLQPTDRNNIKAYYGLPSIDDYATSFVASKEGGYLMAGYTNDQFHSRPENGLLVKIAESGCIEWSKTMEAQFSGRVYKILQLKDGSYSILGYNDNQPYLLKIDPKGNRIWSKKFSLTGLPANTQWMTETADGGLVLVAEHWDYGISVIRTDASGNVLWSKIYKKESPVITFYNPSDVLEAGNDIFIAGAVSSIAYNTPSVLSGFVMKLDKATGATKWTKKYNLGADDMYMRGIHRYGPNLLINSAGPNPSEYSNNTYHILDLDGNVLSSTTIIVPGLEYAMDWTTAVPLPNGDLYFLNTGTQTLSLQPGYVFHSIFLKIGADHSVKWAKDYSYKGSGRFFLPVIGKGNVFAALGNGVGTLMEPFNSLSQKLQLRKIDSSGGGPNVDCDLNQIDVTTVLGMANTQPFTWTTDSVLQWNVKDTSIALNTIYAQVRYKCPSEFVDSCSFLKLEGPRSACNLNEVYTYRVHHNKGCNQPVTWELPATARVMGKTDTEVSVQFTSFGQFTIAALLSFSCTPVKDSMIVEVASKTPPLDLGKDTSVCPGNTLVLHGGPEFLSYQWQDGSQDSLFTVTDAGEYWIIVIDSCGNLLSDTVHISLAAQVPIDIGPDRTKCNNDTLILQAPQGFLNYTWSSSDTSRVVIVNPTVDSFFSVKAEKTPGCFAFDTVRVKVYHSTLIDLGSNQSFCEGDSAVLDAGGDFSSLLWSTGQTGRTIVARNKGSYSVRGVSAEGCPSFDTVHVVAIFPNPVVRLNHDSLLCTGNTRLLDAGESYRSYYWNDGSIARQISVAAPGTYSVEVVDDNGCLGSDSTTIIELLPLPKAFLPEDALVCTYGSLPIKPLRNFNSYQWSTGAITEHITVNKPGVYDLKVVDDHGCTGRDTVVVGLKQCMEGFYIPTAFTPNRDGKNDAFKPLLFGNVVKYRFTIYNRWGSKVFETTELQKGWNGRFQSSENDTGVFVWTCEYQFQGQDIKLEKGSLLLIK